MSDESKTLIAMVALSSPSLPNASVIATAFSQGYPNCGIQNDIDVKDGTFVFDVDGHMAAISGMRAPIPWSDLEGPCATAWWWPDATERMKSHTAHVIVALVGDSGDAIQRHIQLRKNSVNAWLADLTRTGQIAKLDNLYYFIGRRGNGAIQSGNRE